MIKKIIIVGGGTAGWFTASYLCRFLKHRYNVTLVESPDIPKIGVGESVTPHVAAFFQQLGTDEKHWMLHTGSVYKYANKFTGWNKSHKDSEYFGFHYTSPLLATLPESIEDYLYVKDITRNTDTILSLLKRKKLDKFDRYFNWHYHYMQKNVAPFDDNGYIFQKQPFSYSQHVNADRLAEYCRDFIAKPNGAVHISGKVIGVITGENGIKSIRLEDGTILEGDIFIDCSGFKRLLMNAVGCEVKKYQNNPIDRAWVCQVDYVDQKTQLVNYSQSIAREHGWQFKIGLYHRMGTGYCFSSSHCSDQSAVDDFINLLGDSARKEPRLINWNPERLTSPAVKNVVAVGLSNGFIEPLEANGLYVIVASIFNLAECLDKDSINFDTYNQVVNYFMDDIADFLLVHYTLSDRTDTDFWNDCKNIGRKERHDELVLKKYHDEQNFMCSALNGARTLFPDYMWAQLRYSWKLDISDCNFDSVDTYKFVIKHDHLHRTKSAQSINYYDWLKMNIFEGNDSQAWEQQYLNI
jgi:flavin-dependent dehydrogenase